MKNSRNERLSEHLLNVDEDILANAYEVDDSEKLQMYIKKKNAKKSVYITPVFRRVAAFAACLLLIVGVALHVPTFFSPDSGDIGQLSTEGDNSDTDNDNIQKGPYIVADSDDDYDGIELENVKSREERYISNALLEKMQMYRDTDAVYRVIVEIVITDEDNNEFTADEEDEEFLLLYDQLVKAIEEYEDALSKLVGVDEAREKLYEQLQIDEKEALKKELSRKCDARSEELRNEYNDKIANARLEYATQLSETAPVLVTEESGVFIYEAYKGEYAFFMDLSADDINELAEKGGYIFRLASAANETIDRLEQE